MYSVFNPLSLKSPETVLASAKAGKQARNRHVDTIILPTVVIANVMSGYKTRWIWKPAPWISSSAAVLYATCTSTCAVQYGYLSKVIQSTSLCSSKNSRQPTVALQCARATLYVAVYVALLNDKVICGMQTDGARGGQVSAHAIGCSFGAT